MTVAETINQCTGRQIRGHLVGMTNVKRHMDNNRMLKIPTRSKVKQPIPMKPTEATRIIWLCGPLIIKTRIKLRTKDSQDLDHHFRDC